MSKIIKENIEIINELGLHARAAASFVKVAEKYKSDVKIEKDGLSANGKSIMGILMLAAPKGSVVTVTCSGDDAEDAMKELKELINNKFGEER
jgi:phosphocarrier protein